MDIRVCVLHCVRLFVTPWAVAHQAPLVKCILTTGRWGVAIQLTQTLLLGRPQTLQTGTTFREQNLAIPNKSAYAFTLQPIQPFPGTILKIFSNNSKIYAYKVIH